MCVNYEGGCRAGGFRVTAQAPHLLVSRWSSVPAVPTEKIPAETGSLRGTQSLAWLPGWVLAKEESNAVPLCRAKPSPSFINLPASSPPATSLNIQKTKPPSGVDRKPTECLGVLECMYANLQLQTQLARQQMAILENLQASMTQLAPGRGSKNSTLPASSRSLLLNHLPQFTK
ncbi:unnamed protein product [Gulo gulo]|uniref:TSSK6-activating co-chaperone protein n=1 Tax=Gulo gulo TaxID=48420 RepID=A0A9X9M6I3_GULGU|nr:unnamed protein product [Gulo gulo]